LRKIAIEHDERDADHERERELEPLQKSGVAEAQDGAEMQAGAECTEGVEQAKAEEHPDEDAIGERGDAKLAVKTAARRG
jgi:hypothetical protein